LALNPKYTLDYKFRPGDKIAEIFIKGVSLISFSVILLIFVFVFKEALPIFSSNNKVSATQYLESETYGEEPDDAEQAPIENVVNPNSAGAEGKATLSSLLGKEWQPVSNNPQYGLTPLFVGTLKVTVLAVLFAAFPAILAALYTAMFASTKIKNFLKPTIELLAGFPSVVIGFFALITVASLFQNLMGTTYRLNAFVGGLALSLAVIPIIYTITEEALASIPREYTEASLALGATRWQTALFVVLPAATPGVFAAMLLGFGRAFGETMIVLMATGNAAMLSWKIFEPVRTLSATIGAEMAEVVFGDTHYNVLFLIGSLLFIITFGLNAIAEFYVRNRLMKRFQGGA
jgi:phosphate transport system permease protein